jgi:hypothetical protein
MAGGRVGTRSYPPVNMNNVAHGVSYAARRAV